MLFISIVPSGRGVECKSRDQFTLQMFENPQVYNFEGLKSRVLSAGTAPQADHPRYTEMMEAQEAIFQLYQVKGYVTLEYGTQVWYGQLSRG